MLEQVVDQAHRIKANVGVGCYFTDYDSTEKILLCLVFEWMFPSQHDVEENAHCPHITTVARISLLTHYLRGHETRCATVNHQLCFFITLDTETKVYNFDSALIGDEHVVHFEITVTNTKPMHNFNRLRQLPIQLFGLLFFQTFRMFILYKFQQ